MKRKIMRFLLMASTMVLFSHNIFAADEQPKIPDGKAEANSNSNGKAVSDTKSPYPNRSKIDALPSTFLRFPTSISHGGGSAPSTPVLGTQPLATTISTKGSSSAPSQVASALEIEKESSPYDVHELVDREIRRKSALLVQLCLMIDVEPRHSPLIKACYDLYLDIKEAREKNQVLKIENWDNFERRVRNYDNANEINFLPELRTSFLKIVGTPYEYFSLANDQRLRFMSDMVVKMAACATAQNGQDLNERREQLETLKRLNACHIKSSSAYQLALLEKEIADSQRVFDHQYNAAVNQAINKSETMGLLSSTKRVLRRANNSIPLSLTGNRLNKIDLVTMVGEVMNTAEEQLSKLVQMKAALRGKSSARDIAVRSYVQVQDRKFSRRLLDERIGLSSDDWKWVRELNRPVQEVHHAAKNDAEPTDRIRFADMLLQYFVKNDPQEKFGGPLATLLAGEHYARAIFYAHRMKKHYASAMELAISEAMQRCLSKFNFDGERNLVRGANPNNYIVRCVNGPVMIVKKINTDAENKDVWDRDNHFGESRAYRASRIMGFNFVPISGEIILKGNLYSYQLMVDHAITRLDIERPERHVLVNKSLKTKIYDAVIGNPDRVENHGNLMIEINDQTSQILIDNGKAFTPKGWIEFKYVLTQDPTFLMKLQSASADEKKEIDEALGKYYDHLAKKSEPLHDIPVVSLLQREMAMHRITVFRKLLRSENLTEAKLAKHAKVYIEMFRSRMAQENFDEEIMKQQKRMGLLD